MTTKEKRKKVIHFYKYGSIDNVNRRIDTWFDKWTHILDTVESWDDESMENEYNALISLKYIKKQKKL